MKEGLPLYFLFVVLLFLPSDANANATIRRDDGGQHSTEKSANNDFVEFVQHVAEREEKTRKVDGASPVVSSAASIRSRQLLDQLDQLTRFQNMQNFGAAATANDQSQLTSDQMGRERLISSFDYFTRSLLTRKTFQIECCRGGYPQMTHPDLVRNFTFSAGEYLTDETEPLSGDPATDTASGEESPSASSSSSGRAAGAALNCRMYYGAYMTPPAALLSFELSSVIQVVCKCPDIGPGHQLDNNCRRLPICRNNGFRSSIDPQKCLCLQPFFGDKCEKFCDRGQRIRGLNGRDYCSCSPFYTGDECRDMVCMNGGHEDNGRCICPVQYFGFHCEIDINRTKTSGGHFHTPVDFSGRTGGSAANDGSTRYQRFGDHVSNEMFTRDISGTIFSLIMIIVLVVSLYLLMKHRMQTRYLNRRPDLLNACNFPRAPAFGAPGATDGVPSTARRIELMPTFDGTTAGAPTAARTFPFRSLMGSLANTFIPGDGGPPPYIAPGQRGRRNRDDVLPPLPSYEDATKLPPLRPNIIVAEPPAERDHRSMEMMTRRHDTALAPTIAVTRTSDETQTSPSDHDTATRRHRPSRYTPHHVADVCVGSAETQEEAISLRSADDEDHSSATTNAMTTTGTQSSQQFSPSDDKEQQAPPPPPTTTTTTIEANNAGENGSQKRSNNEVDNNRRQSSDSRQQNQRQQQRRERSLEPENDTVTTTIQADNRHTAV